MPSMGVRNSPLMTLCRDAAGPAAAQVLDIVRAGGPITRDEVAAAGELSVATVRRVASSLIAAGVLDKCLDSSREGAVGRPGARLEVATDSHVVIGVNVARTSATVALGDLSGRVVART